MSSGRSWAKFLTNSRILYCGYTPIPLIAENNLPSAGGTILLGAAVSSTRASELTSSRRCGKAETRLTRRANALLLLDHGMSCEEIAKVLYLDDDTIRYWYHLYSEKGLSWLADFGYRGRSCELTAVQQDAAQTLPRTTAMVGEWIENSYRVSYSRS
jgi:Winged helix-turn helix